MHGNQTFSELLFSIQLRYLYVDLMGSFCIVNSLGYFTLFTAVVIMRPKVKTQWSKPIVWLLVRHALGAAQYVSVNEDELPRYAFFKNFNFYRKF